MNELLILRGEGGYNALRDLRYLCRDLRDTLHHTGRNLIVKILSGLNEPLRLCVQSGNYLFDDRGYCAGKPFDIRHNSVVHGAHRFGGGKLSRSAHCGGHIRRNAFHTVAEAYAYAVSHIPADFGENGGRGVNAEEAFDPVDQSGSPAGYFLP